jgi:hypothetical protein
MKNVFIFLVIFCTTFMLACSIKSEEKTELLECVLDAYIATFSKRLGSDVSIVESHGWTDSTVHLYISTIEANRIGPGVFHYSEYNGLRLFLSQGRLYQSDGGKFEPFLNKRIMIPNSLDWKLIELKNDPRQDMAPPESFDDLQLVFSPSKKCIEKSNLLSTACGFCKEVE